MQRTCQYTELSVQMPTRLPSSSSCTNPCYCYPDWREATPSGYVIRASKTGYIQSKLFAEYGEKFIQFLKEKKLDKNGKHLLLLDSHSSYSFNLHFMQYMKAHDVEVLCFPPHCTHLMQLLDNVPFGQQ